MSSCRHNKYYEMSFMNHANRCKVQLIKCVNVCCVAPQCYWLVNLGTVTNHSPSEGMWRLRSCSFWLLVAIFASSLHSECLHVLCFVRTLKIHSSSVRCCQVTVRKVVMLQLDFNKSVNYFIGFSFCILTTTFNFSPGSLLDHWCFSCNNLPVIY